MSFVSSCRVSAGAVAVCVMAMAAGAQAPQLPQQDRALAHDIFKEIIEINSQDSNGSVTAVSEALKARFLAGGFGEDDLVIAGPNARKMDLVVRYRGTDAALKPILIIGHTDVVEARREDWTTDPYQFVEKDGYFYGRGTQDMKGEDACVAETLIRLKREGWKPKRDIVVAFTADEESGGFNGVEWLLKNRPELMRAEFVLNPDSGGVGLRNGVPVEVNVQATQKTYADFRITATNPGGHSSQPRKDNAIYELMHALLKIEATPFPAELNPISRAELEAKAKVATPERAAEIRSVLASPMDEKALAALSDVPGYNAKLRTTCVATMLKGGHAPNALPGMAQANVNCRILPGHSQEEVRQDLVRMVADPKLKVEYMANNGAISAEAPARKSLPAPPLREDVFGPLRTVVDAMWPETPPVPIIPVMSAGASDSVYTLRAGIPSYGVGGIGIEGSDNREHGRDERVKAESFYAGAEFYYLYLKAVD